MKNNIRITMQFFVVIMMFTTKMFVGMVLRNPKKINLSKSINLSKKYPYLQSSQSRIIEFFEGPTAADFEVDIEPAQIHVVPTDTNTLKLLDLCPLFEKPEAFIDPELAATLEKNEIETMLQMQIAEKMPKYHVFENSNFEIRYTGLDVSCIVPLGKFGNWSRDLMQLKSLDQDKLAKETKLSQFLCAGHSLNNSRLIRNYALDGEIKYLKKLHDMDESAGFLIDLGIGEWPDVKRVKEEIKHVGQLLNVNNIEKDISAVSSVLLFGSQLGTLDKEEFDYVQKVKKSIHEGLKQNNYVHIIIVGNEEFAVKHGHYFCLAIIKSGNDIQYVVLDTLPGIYHLQEGSHERNRLMFLIDNIEKGHSSVKVASLSEIPTFMQNVEVPTEEGLLEVQLSNERMPEVGDFENQIRFLNDFSRKLNQFGVQKQLAKELRVDLIKYLNVMREISDVYGEEDTYPALRKVIEARLKEM